MSDGCTTSLDDINKGALPPQVIPPAIVPTIPVEVVNTCAKPVLVKICEATPKLYDREMFVLCAPDGTKVMVQNVTAEDAPLGTAPVFEAWNLDSTPYTGAIAALKDCASEKLDFVPQGEFCVDGVNLTRTDLMDAQTGLPISSVWQDMQGVIVAVPPAGAVILKGVCAILPQQRKVLIYLERNGGVVAMSDIVAAVGTTQIQSVTVKQIQGIGAVTGDSGSGVPLSQGETWSWSAVTGEDALDMLGASALSMDAGGGEQRITATYIP